jgi:hypothetical protein
LINELTSTQLDKGEVFAWRNSATDIKPMEFFNGKKVKKVDISATHCAAITSGNQPTQICGFNNIDANLFFINYF